MLKQKELKCSFFSPCNLQVNIRGEDIVDGNPKLTLGLIWTIILHFQVSFTNLKVLIEDLSDVK